MRGRNGLCNLSKHVATGPGRRLTSRLPRGWQPCPTYKYMLHAGRPTCIPAPRPGCPPGGREAAGGPARPATAVTPGEWERARCGVSSGPAGSGRYLSVLADVPGAQAALSPGKASPSRQPALLGRLGCVYAGLGPGE